MQIAQKFVHHLRSWCSCFLYVIQRRKVSAVDSNI